MVHGTTAVALKQPEMWVGWEEKDDPRNPVFLTVTSSLMNLHCKRSWITREVFIHLRSFQSAMAQKYGTLKMMGDSKTQHVQTSGPCGPSGLNKWEGASEVGKDAMELLLDAVKRYDFIISERIILNFLLH